MKVALITGITGQDGAYLTQLLLSKGYEVHGLLRQSSIHNTDRIDHLKNIKFHYGDLSDSASIIRIIQAVHPDEIYNLGAMSHVKVSFDSPEYTANVDGLGALRILEAVRVLGLQKKTKIYQASSSEMYGQAQEVPQKETTPFHPRSPYAISKLFAYWTTVNYREAYGLFACNGILFNHESPIRGENFVTRKITQSVAKISLGVMDKFFIGNLNATRDWGHAEDYTHAMWLMLQQERPEDYVIATGITTSVREFIQLSFKEVGIDIEFKSQGLAETGHIVKCRGEFKLPLGKEVVAVDKAYFRPTEVESILGDASKAKNKLGWKPKHDLHSLIQEMVGSDLASLRRN